MGVVGMLRKERWCARGPLFDWFWSVEYARQWDAKLADIRNRSFCADNNPTRIRVNAHCH